MNEDNESEDSHESDSIDDSNNGNACELNRPIHMDEVVNAIKSMKLNKSPGLDGIPIEIFKHAPRNVLEIIHALFSHLFENGIFPSAWTRGIIVPIHKKGPINEPGNYRPITLLDAFGKIFTFILNSRLSEWCDQNMKIPESQAGFRKGYSTVHNLFTLYGLIQRRLLRPKAKCYCIFVDFRQAFDSVSRDLLVKKLIDVGISGKMQTMLTNLNKTVKACIRQGNIISDFFNCATGLKQGCLISPIQFALFISELSNFLDRNNAYGLQLFPDIAEVKALYYADDIVIMADTIGGLHKHIASLQEFCDSWKMKVNINKTQIMIFRKGGRIAKNENWSYKNKPLDIVSTYRYLGLQLSTGNAWGKATKSLADQATKALNSLRAAMHKVGDMSSCLLLQDF